MPKFTIEHTSQHDAETAYSKIKDFLSKDQDLRRFDPKLTCEFNDATQSCIMKSSQFSVEMKVLPQSDASKVKVDVDLAFILTPFKSKVQETLQRKLAKHLG